MCCAFSNNRVFNNNSVFYFPLPKLHDNLPTAGNETTVYAPKCADRSSCAEVLWAQIITKFSEIPNNSVVRVTWENIFEKISLKSRCNNKIISKLDIFIFQDVKCNRLGSL